MKNLDKRAILSKAIESLNQRVKSLGESLTGTNSAINDAPGAMQSHSDTKRSQLTAVVDVAHKAFNDKVDELNLLRRFDSDNSTKLGPMTESRLGAIIVIQKKSTTNENYFLLPGGSGIKIEYEGQKFICITPSSPLGMALLGKKKNESFSLQVGSSIQQVKVLDIL